MQSDSNSRQLPFDRYSLQDLCAGDGLLGIELGVASGGYSRYMVWSGRFRDFFGVDVYSDHHNTQEYIDAIEAIGVFERYKLLRMTFEEALHLFEDETFDFVYVDGYAHTGKDGGRTLSSWLAKVKIGGVFAGHDYHPDWPLVVSAVNELCEQTGFELMITQTTENGGPFDMYPSWAMVKTRAISPLLSVSSSDLPRQAWVAPTRSDPYQLPFTDRVREAAKLIFGQRVSALLRLK